LHRAHGKTFTGTLWHHYCKIGEAVVYNIFALYCIFSSLTQPEFIFSSVSNLVWRKLTVDAMEVLIKYCMNSFPQVDQFIRIQISFYFLCISYWSIGSETKSNWLI
jgi:hypothetical protein